MRDGLFELHPSKTAKRVIQNAKREWEFTKFKTERSFSDLDACIKMVRKSSGNYGQAIKDRDKYNANFLASYRKTLDDAEASKDSVVEKSSGLEF